MAKYLIIGCEELSDQWECDANKTPICITDDYEKYDEWGYEIYEILEDNTFNLIKSYEDASDTGIAFYKWFDIDRVEKYDPDVFLEYHTGENRNFYTKTKIKELKDKYHFKESVKNIYKEIQQIGVYGEEVDGEWYVIAEYIKGFYPFGY